MFKIKSTKVFLFIIVLFSLIVFLLIKNYYHFATHNTSNNNGEWESSLTFRLGNNTLIGDPFHLGIVNQPFVSGKEYAITWYLWGDQDDLVKEPFKLIATKPTGQNYTLVENYAIAYGTEGSNAQVPTLFTIPSPGIWQLSVYINNDFFGSIVLNVE